MKPYLKPTMLLILFLGSLGIALTSVSAQGPRLDSNQYRINRLAPGVINDQAVFHIDQSNSIMFEILASSNGVQTSILGPGGQLIDPNTVGGFGGTYQSDEVGSNQGPLILPTLTRGFHSVYSFPSLGAGDYTIRFQAGSQPTGEISIFTQVTTDSKITTSFLTTESVITLGSPVVMSLALFNARAPVPGATVAVIVKPPSGSPVNLTLLDDGGTADGAAGDGLYSGEFTPSKVGKHTALARVNGSVGGVTFSREATANFTVVAQPTTLTGAVSDRGVDDNANTLFDRVVLTAGVNATQAGKHRLFARLKMPSGATVIRSTEQNLVAGTQNIEVSFETSALTALGEKGPYTIDSLELDILGENGESPSDRLFNIGPTRAYQLTEFEQASLSFVGVTSAQGEDTNGNGLFDKLVVLAQVRTAAGGQYSWSLKLVDQSRGEIDFTSGSGSLNAGLNTVKFEFRGTAIGAYGVDGPYLLRDLLLFGTSTSLVQSDAGQTQAFKANQFEGFNPDISNLAITQTASPNPVTTGANITYVLTVTNSGPRNAPSVIVTDNLPASTTFVSCVASGGGICGGSGNNRTVTFATLNTGESATVMLVASVNNGINTSVTNTATVASTASDPDSSNNTATVTVQVAGVQVTVQTIPSGRTFTVDGTTYSAAETFSWLAGSTHTIGTVSPQSGGSGTQYVWSNWTDLGAMSHSVAPSGSITYTANFTTQYLLTMVGGAGGTVSPLSGYFNAGTAMNISATANAGSIFTGWAGIGSGSYTGSNNPANVTMNGPISETATFDVASSVWKNIVGVAVPGNSLMKTTADGWGNSGASSIATIPSGEGYVEFTATETNKDRMCGLSSGDSNQSYTEIRYALDLTPGGIAWVFESGVSKGVYTQYQSGDRFRIGVEGGLVKYRKNGALFYTSNVAPSYPLLVDTSLYSNGATITNVVISGAGSPPPPPTVTTTAAISTGNTTATLNGSVNPNGLGTTAWFEWGTDSTLTNNTQTSAQSIGSGTSSQAISANLSGLSTNITYYFRAVASNNAGQTKGSPILSFTTGTTPGQFWVNVVGVSPSGNSLTKTAADGWGNGGASSSATIASGDGYVEFTATETTKDRMAGLSNGDSNQNYTDIDFAINLTPGGTAWVFESGVSKGVYTLYQAGDRFHIGVEAGVVKYRKNGTSFYTSSVSPTYPLLLDTSLYSTAATITDASVVVGSPFQDVVWTNLLGVSVAGNSLLKTAGDGWGNAGASSTKAIASGDGYVEFTATETNKDRMAGLSNGDTNKEFADIDFALNLAPGGIAWVFESGVSRGVYSNYQAGDVFRIAVEGGIVKYRKNGTLFYTSSVAPVYPLLLDTALYSTGATVTNALIAGNLVPVGQPVVGPPTATTTAATSVTSSGATLNGGVNPNGIATTAWFEWGTNSTLASSTQTSPQAIGSGTSSQAISANLSGLSSGTYYFRAVASNSAGPGTGSILSFSVGGPTTESVVWTEAVGVLVSGSNLTKTAGDGWGNAGASSTKGIASGDGYVEFTATETNKDRMAGLSNGDTNKEFADIDFAMNLTPGGIAWVFESGVSKGVYTNYQAGDVFRIAVEGGVVKYRKNGTLFYTSNVVPVYPLLLDTSLNSNGATISAGVISGNLQSLVPTLENVVWTNLIGASALGNSLTKTAGDGWGNAGAVSTRAIPSGDGYVQFTATETTRDRMAGLSKGDANQHYSDIDYAVNLTPGGTAWVFESGVSRGVYTLYQAGDVFRIGVEGGVVKYSKNGSVFYTSSVAPAYPLLLDTSLYSTGATITNAVIFGKF